MNYKKIALATLVLAIVWFVMDFVIHGVLLMGIYQSTSAMWRPMEDMSFAYSIFVTLVFSLLFVLFYTSVVTQKTVSNGVKFGLWYGLLGGFAMGFGSYSYLPISFALASYWFLALLAESLVGGVVVGYLTKE